MQHLVSKFTYKGFEIKVYKAISQRFGVMYSCENNIGEPKMSDTSYKTPIEAINAEEMLIDKYIDDTSDDRDSKTPQQKKLFKIMSNYQPKN